LKIITGQYFSSNRNIVLFFFVFPLIYIAIFCFGYNNYYKAVHSGPNKAALKRDINIEREIKALNDYIEFNLAD